jgi:hypothetical protein
MPPKIEIGDIIKVTKTDDEWKKLLSPAAYQVLRHEDTERAFTSPLHENHQAGTYYCAGCDLPAYSSEHKFDSGHRLAQLLATDRRQGGGETNRYQVFHDPGRGPLRPMRRPSRTCLR